MSVKTLRFEPYPMDQAERKLPIDKWTGVIDIPEDSDVRIEALPSRHIVYAGKATDSISRNYQPGKYVYTIKKFISARKDGSPGRSLCTSGTFLIDVTEEQWANLQNMSPRLVRARQTTEGPRLICTVCNKQSETRIAAFIHEAKEHLGIDPLKDPQKAIQVELGAAAMKKQMVAAKNAEAEGGMNDPKVASI